MQSLLCSAVYMKNLRPRMKEQELVEKLQHNDREAQRLLYERQAGRLMALCLRYVGERAAAEDVLHDAFLKIFGSIRRFSWRGDGSLRGWMDRVVINHAIEYLRKEKRLHVLVADDLPTETDDVLPVETIEQLSEQTLLRLIAELPDGYRTIFNLYCIEGLSHAEIANLLGIQSKSSSSQLARARKLLAAAIQIHLKQSV